jgi:hypothetical protein
MYLSVFLTYSEIREIIALQTVGVAFTLLINGYFVILWLLRFSIVLFRMHLVKLRESQFFRFLNFININDYEEDLIEMVEIIAAKKIN